MNTMVDLLTSESGWRVYIIMFGLIFLENALPFIPGDTVLAFSAYFAGMGILRPYFSFLLTVAAAVTAFIFIYIAAHFWGRTFIVNLKFSFLSPAKMAKVDRLFHRYGYWGLAVGRFVPGIRLLIAFMAGFTRLKISSAVLCTFIGIVGWNGMVFLLGRLVGENRQMVVNFLAKYNSVSGLITLAVLLILMIWLFNQKARRMRKSVNG